jgi:hypothetical protein
MLAHLDVGMSRLLDSRCHMICLVLPSSLEDWLACSGLCLPGSIGTGTLLCVLPRHMVKTQLNQRGTTVKGHHYFAHIFCNLTSANTSEEHDNRRKGLDITWLPSHRNGGKIFPDKMPRWARWKNTIHKKQKTIIHILLSFYFNKKNVLDRII